MTLNLKSRVYAASIHLIISLVIIGFLFLFTYFLWFPNNLIFAGAITGLSILILVDIILGPVLTLVVFDKTKSSLKFDLTCIAILQLSCLAYGTIIIYQERPVVQILVEDAINLYTISELKENTANINYDLFSGPIYYYQDLPSKLEEIIISKTTYEITQGKPYALKSDLMISADKIAPHQFKERIKLIRDNLLENQLKELNFINSKQNCDWIPLNSKHVDSGYACVNHKLGIIDFKKI